MALLRNSKGDFRVPCRCLVGRSYLADVPLESPRASSEHATLAWNANRWTLRDLGSSNGTTVNGRPLLTRDRVTLNAGCQIRFGGDDEAWLFSDATAPEPCAALLGPQQYQWGQQSLLVLPTVDEPEASVFLDGDQWRVDSGTEVRTAECGDVVKLASGYWRLLLPDSVEAPDAPTASYELDLAGADLCFRISDNNVSLTIEQNSRKTALPSRACLQTLMALAEIRLKHVEGGWISSFELAQLRGCSSEKINVDVHRLRKMFQEAGVHQAARIIERDDAKRLRIGVTRIRKL